MDEHSSYTERSVVQGALIGFLSSLIWVIAYIVFLPPIITPFWAITSFLIPYLSATCLLIYSIFFDKEK